MSVRVTADQGPGTPTDAATLLFAAPNKVKVVAGKTVLVSDGKTVRQTDGKSLYTGKAPANLADLELPMDTGSLAADMAMAVFLTPGQFGRLPEFTDAGSGMVAGHAAERLTAENARGAKTVWLDSVTGLPLKYFYQRKKGSFTITFGPYALNKAVAASVFTMPASAKLAAFVTPADPPLLASGTAAPDFTLMDTQGNPVHLAEYKGRVVMLDFWASWCGPCKMAMPHVEKIYSDLQSKGLTVLSINTWDQKPFMDTFVAAHPWYTTTMLFDPNPGDKSLASSQYKVTGIPTAYIIGPDGTIAAGFVGYEPGDENKMRAALAKLGVQ